MNEAKNYADYRKGIMNRYISAGLNGFFEHEVLELILNFTTPRRDVRKLADVLLKKFGGIRGVQNASVKELLTVPGMSMQAATLIKFAQDFSEFCLMQGIKYKGLIKCGQDFINYCILSMAGLRDENFNAAFLNVQSEIMAIETIHVGTVDQSVIYPRKVVERAIHHNAVALIFIHNHPGGNVQPSYADRELTNILVSATSIMDIEVYDHIIVGRDGYFSFREEGLIERPGVNFKPVIRMQSPLKRWRGKGRIYSCYKQKQD